MCMGVQKWKDGGGGQKSNTVIGAQISYYTWKNKNYNGITFITLLNLFPPSSAVDQAVYDS